MSDDARGTLKQLVGKHGSRLAGEPGRLRGFFGDYCPKQYRQSSLLVTVAEQGMARELVGAGPGSLAGMITGMVDRLHNSRGMKRQDAQWAVESWVLALGLTMTPEVPKARQMIVKAICSREKLWYAIVFEQDALGNWVAKRSLKVKEGRKQAGHEANVLRGLFYTDSQYGGCPYCKAVNGFLCQCGALNCDGIVRGPDQFAVCGQCNISSKLTVCEGLQLNGYADM
jgi:hypothetical protein